MNLRKMFAAIAVGVMTAGNAFAQQTYEDMECLTVNEQVTTVITATEPIRFVDISTEKIAGDQDFPVSIEVQLLGGNGKDERSTMNLCTPGTNVVMDSVLIEQHCNNSKSKTHHGDDWVTVELEVHGGEVIRHFVDGEEVLHYEKPQLDPRDSSYTKLLNLYGDIIITKGTISLQAESHNTDFRKIEVLKLD